MAHSGYNEKNNTIGKNYKYRYNTKEYQDELGLNLYDYGARNYDAALGRWMNVDPLAEEFPGWNPYHYVHNNPINLVDPTGMRADPPENGDFQNGDVHNDSTESWTFNKGMWHDNSGGENNFIPEIVIGKSDSDKFVSFLADFTGGSQAVQIDAEARELSRHSDGSTDWGGYAGYSLMMEKATNPGALEMGRNLFGRSLSNVKTSSGVVSNAASTLSKSEYLRIQNASTRINKPITVVGSRASGTADAYSDWDYVIPGLNSRNWSTIKNSLPGAKSALDNTPRNIDVFKGSVDKSRPHITIKPK